MLKHLSLGRFGESTAVRFLKQRGHRIEAVNWRTKWGEIDIISSTGQKLHFIEVKTRLAGHPFRGRDAVDGKKQERIQRLALQYVRQKRLFRSSLQYDIIELTVCRTGLLKRYRAQLHYLPNAFGGHW